ncbi:polyadenylate-binding protein-interacting protein 2B [Stomoxys calcitrans]|uniref:Ataxin-2 C-terminal domain-containing protein n=1 Tax=Stomoxys calcitrans TaxID=35570 RepID=A0A1I8NLC2_STOCA|nr:polyadenylate-binding protein-interacting protein 2B [Stomoxys calcitrans]XP_013102926.1 polyadenylate-binding protein-interacting protein 2B [Stomoxys calcitrans]XP_013102927.1 polyadenylate-binding protein-interacting protein 2B [Stomoxys calcitrans]XP_013102928.1 polyadenylate-binding protein-interacting protein 2B [Stomoxys calcitrans]
MMMKIPSSDWSDQFEQYIIEEESDNDLDDEPDFSEYLWMENEEEFDKTELQRLEDEDLMKECLDAMLDDELEEQINEWEKVKNDELNAALSSLAVSEWNVANSLLNPLAAEFIPQSHLIIDLGSS